MPGIEPWVASSHERALSAAADLLARHRIAFPEPARRRGGAAADLVDRTATALMDLYRRTRSQRAFDLLVGLTRDRLLARARCRARMLGRGGDPEELLQDALVNMFRYPDRFDARRPGAFRAWSSAIIDNAVRRRLRRPRRPVVQLRSFDALEREPYRRVGPAAQAANAEACREAARAWAWFLRLYLAAYHRLNERERLVLHLVEVCGRRYAEVAADMGMRPEAIKMVVFRARRRIFARIAAWLPDDAVGVPAAGKPRGRCAAPARAAG